MKRYDTYKNSDVEWIGEIPSQWQIKSLKYLSEVTLGKMLCPEDKGGYLLKPYLKSKNIGRGKLNLSSVDEMWFSPSELNSYRLEKEDILLSEGGEVGKAAVWNNELDECYIQNSVHRIRIDKNFYNRYFYYYLTHLEASGFYRSIVSQVSIAHLTKEKLVKIPCIVPNKSEQISIATYLDNKTIRINQIIQQKELLLEKLQAKRQAIINEAVTIGLNRDVPMRHSGVEWLGDVPEHWQVKKLKYISPSISVGLVINPSSYYSDNGEVPMITGKHIQPFKIDAGTAKKITKSSNDELWRSQIHYQDIVVVRVGYPGIAAVVPKEADGFNCASMMIVRKGDFNSDFLCFCFNSTIGKEQVSLVEYGAAQRQFNLSHAVNFIFPVPPIEEQKEIVMWLQNKFQEFDVLNSKLIVQIEKLKLYRQSLISEVVTGKIKVV